MKIHGTESRVRDESPKLGKEATAWLAELEQDEALKARVASDARRVEAGLAPAGVEVDIAARLADLRARPDGPS